MLVGTINIMLSNEPKHINYISYYELVYETRLYTNPYTQPSWMTYGSKNKKIYIIALCVIYIMLF